MRSLHLKTSYGTFFLANLLSLNLISSLAESATSLPSIGRQLQFNPQSSGFAKEYKCLPPRKKNIKPAPEIEPALLELLKEGEKNGTVVFSIFHSTEDKQHSRQFDVTKYAGNWMKRLRCLGVKLIVAVSSPKFVPIFRSVGALPYYSKSFLAKLKKVAGEDVTSINLGRWVYAEIIMKAGFNVQYTDLDVSWFEDPRGKFDLEDYAVVAQPSSNDGNPPNEFNILALTEEAEKHDESMCCQGGIAEISLGVSFMRASPEAIQIAQQIRYHNNNGPCENQQAQVWALFENCKPLGTINCAVGSQRYVTNSVTFEKKVQKLKNPADGQYCNLKYKKRCPDSVREEVGPMLLHFDDAQPKPARSNLVDLRWPPCDEGEKPKSEL